MLHGSARFREYAACFPLDEVSLIMHINQTSLLVVAPFRFDVIDGADNRYFLILTIYKALFSTSLTSAAFVRDCHRLSSSQTTSPSEFVSL